MRTNRFDLGGARCAAPHLRARVLARVLTGLIAAGVLAACSTATDASVATDELVLELLAAAPSEATSAPTPIRELDGATVSGEVVVALRTNASTVEVRFHVDDVDLAGAPAHVAAAAPFVYTFDADELADGPHTLTAAAIDRRGRAKLVTARFEVVADPSGDPAPTPPGPEDPAPEDPAPEDPAPEDPAPEDPAPDPVPAPSPFAATLYVSPSGSDGHSGRSVDRPLRTVQAAADRVVAGDVVALRGGVYPINVRFTRSGTSSAPIVWTSYPGELAVFDGSDQTPVSSSHRMWVSASWNVFQDFEVRNGPQEGIMVNGAHDNVFRRLDVHHHHYSGILNYGGNRNLYEDIRTHDNYDRYNPSGRIGDDADGISISSGDRNVLRRVVAYRNSDDGIDSWRATNTLIEDSVAYGNGLGSHGNGNGIKAGGNSEWVHTTVRRSIAFDNRGHGFDHNSGKGVVFLNNTAYRNGGYGYVAGEETKLRNNLSVDDPAGLWGSDSSHNGWELGVTDPRFVSTDPNSADFLRLRSDSPAIDRGVPVGLPYTGSAPDLGALGDGMTYAALLAPTAAGTLGGATAALR